MDNNVWSIENLREVALNQHGFVTSAQAIDAGVTKSTLSKLVSRGRLERAAHGIYRVPQVPFTQYGPLMLAVLWTGVPEAALSHETALDLYEVSDINPTQIFVTVAKSRRIRRQGQEKYQLYYQDLLPSQISWRELIPTVTLATAVEQCIDTGVPTYLLRQAIENGSRQGLIPPSKIDDLQQRLKERNG